MVDSKYVSNEFVAICDKMRLIIWIETCFLIKYYDKNWYSYCMWLKMNSLWYSAALYTSTN